MSAVHETAVELTTVVQHLEKLAWELRDSSRRRIPAEVSAACDALNCAALLLRTHQDVADGHTARMDLLYEAVALARSTVEATKMACREHAGARSRAGGRG
ncbi:MULTISPECIES: hypothetical protein [Streptomyces]|jgi:hypothetical protein|uniref:hypothetical protein n=1 Tax=Streptomyces TaxID=1883 RepID=UPI00117DDFAF|nr:hypothetical protein [Streptomyces glaucescens]